MPKNLLIISLLTIISSACMGVDLHPPRGSTSSSSSSTSITSSSNDGEATTQVTAGEPTSSSASSVDTTTSSSSSTATIDLTSTSSLGEASTSSTTNSTGEGGDTTMPPTEAGCGNGTVEENESCDDGNKDGDDLCNNSCKLNCGNGKLDGAQEECDDKNNINDDACSNTCIKNGRLVFITSVSFEGKINFSDWNQTNLEDDETVYLGLKNRIDDADMHCWKLAHLALHDNDGLGLSWSFAPPDVATLPFKAWLSDDVRSPARTAPLGFKECNDNLPYILYNGDVVATSFENLTGSGPITPINMCEDGTSIQKDQEVWTGTNKNGYTLDLLEDCHNWNENNDDNIKGRTGLARQKKPEPPDPPETWTNNGALQCRDLEAHLYCFEQCPETP